MPELRCAICRVQACRDEPGATIPPPFCPMVQDTEALPAARETYRDEETHKLSLVTVLVAKDRVTGHNPAAALYISHSYYRSLKAGHRSS